MLTVAEFGFLAERVNNWKRWGADGQRGTLGFLTPDVVRRGTASVVTGETFSPAMSLSSIGPQNGTGVPGRINPVRTMLAVNTPMADSPDACAYSDDIVVTPTQAATHRDAVDASVATRPGIETADTIVSRGCPTGSP
ncbi:hypothetical protein [Streptomyces sp. NPDC002276]